MNAAVPVLLTTVLIACSAAPSPGVRVEPPELPPADSSARRHAFAVRVDDPEAAASRLEAAAKERDGYVAARLADEPVPGSPRSLVVTVNVDLRRADAMIEAVKSLGTVVDEQVQIEDLAAEVVSRNAKMAAARATEARLREWAEGPQRECARLGEVERERAKALDEIAALIARQRIQESKSQYASLSVRLAGPDPAPPSFASEVRDTVRRAGNDPGAAARAAAVQGIVWGLPLLAIGATLCAVSRRRGRRPGGPGERPAA